MRSHETSLVHVTLLIILTSASRPFCIEFCHVARGKVAISTPSCMLCTPAAGATASGGRPASSAPDRVAGVLTPPLGQTLREMTAHPVQRRVEGAPGPSMLPLIITVP